MLLKIGNTPTDQSHLQIDFKLLTVQNTLYAPSTYPRGPNFGPFHSTTNFFFRGTRLSKIRNAPNNLRMTINIEMSNLKCSSSIYIKNLPPEVPILVRFALRADVLEVRLSNVGSDIRLTLNAEQSKVLCIN